MFKMVLKFLFAAAIIYWLIQSGKLDFRLVQKSLTSGYTWLICIVLIVIQDIVSALRWKILLEVRSQKKLPFLALVRLTWIGLFFNSVLPGAVTGDLIKLVYARDLDRDLSKTFLVTTALMDRVLGLMGLLTILGFFSLIYYPQVTSFGPKMQMLVHFNFVLFLGAIGFIVTLFMNPKGQQWVFRITDRIPVIGHRIGHTLKQVWAIGENKKIVLKCLGISIFLQFINIIAFWAITSPFYDKPLPFQYAFTFIPLGIMAVAVPISPSGLGVGHIIFDKLFHYAGIAQGASLFNLYFLALVSINLLGLIPYILSGRKHSLGEAEEFEQELEEKTT